PVELKRAAEGPDRRHVRRAGETIVLVLEAVRRRRLAMPGQVEREDAKVIDDRPIVHHVAELASVGPGGVQADQRNPLPRLLEIQAMRPPDDRDIGVAADNRLEHRGHQRPPSARRRGAASMSLKYRRFAISGWKWPSMRNWPRLARAKMSWKCGGGNG